PRQCPDHGEQCRQAEHSDPDHADRHDAEHRRRQSEPDRRAVADAAEQPVGDAVGHGAAGAIEPGEFSFAGERLIEERRIAKWRIANGDLRSTLTACRPAHMPMAQRSRSPRFRPTRPSSLSPISTKSPVDAEAAWSDSSGMVVIRTILAVLIAISVVILPAAGEPIVSTPPAAVAMADQADMPCCPCCDTQDHLKATACVLKCLT